MAYYYSLEAECGTHREAEAFSIHFNSRAIKLSDGLEINLYSRGESRDESGHWWCSISPEGASYAALKPKPDGSGSIDEQRIIQTREQHWELTHNLYEQLKSAPPFRYALIGWEIQHFLTFPELMSEDTGLDWAKGLVVSQEIWKGIKKSEAFVPFCIGYYWQPYQTNPTSNLFW